MNKNILYVIDLDRTLVDVEKVMEVTEEVCDELGVDFKKIYKDQRDLAKIGAAYSPFSYISDQSNVDIEQFKKRFIELSAKDKLLFSDSREFIDNLKGARRDFMILTHGVDNDWQILKIQASNLAEVPYVIVKNRHKSRFISRWIDQDNLFNPQIDSLGVYKKCVFVDDRKEAFIEIPSNCSGYLLDRGGIEDDSNLPENVKTIKILSEVEI